MAARRATTVSEHTTVLEAFGAIKALSAQMMRTGEPGDMVELIVR